MRIFRLCRRSFARSPLDGRGGLVASGRWHTPRRLVCYASESVALASMEVLVHCDLDLVPVDLVAIEIDVPDGVAIDALDVRDLPRSWRRYPAPRLLQRLGNDWLDRAGACLLRLPSAIVPSESSFLVNPVHPEVRELRLVGRSSFRFDPRLTHR